MHTSNVSFPIRKCMGRPFFTYGTSLCDVRTVRNIRHMLKIGIFFAIFSFLIRK